MSSSKPHLALDHWLHKLELEQYIPLFKKYGGVEDILWLSERDLKSIGVTNGSHRARMVTSLVILRGKYEKVSKGNGESVCPKQGSRAHDTSPNPKGSSSPICHPHLQIPTSGVRSWPTSGPSSVLHSKHSSHRSSMSKEYVRENNERLLVSGAEPLLLSSRYMHCCETCLHGQCSKPVVSSLGLNCLCACTMWLQHVATEQLDLVTAVCNFEFQEASIGTDTTPDELKKALEKELSLDSSDLRSYAWYHGTILRQRAEELVSKDGNFLIRDCISQPGDFVITCRWENLPLHFIIKKVLLQPDTVYEKIQYQFENDSFESIPDFVTYYVGSKCPLSVSSGAIILYPVNRSMPLSYYASRYGIQCQMHYAARALEKIEHKSNSSGRSPKHTPDISPQQPRRVLRSQETLITVDLALNNTNRASANSSPLNDAGQAPQIQWKALTRVGSDSMLSPTMERRALESRPHSGTISTEAAKEIASQIQGDKPPPKPSRVPSKKCVQRPIVIKRERKITPTTPVSEHEENKMDLVHKISDSECTEIGRDDAVFKTPVGKLKRKTSGETRFSFLDRPSVSDDESSGKLTVSDKPYTIPPLQRPSYVNPSEFKSPLLQAENKPLGSELLNRVKDMLLSGTSKVLAYHLTKMDLEIARNFKEQDLGLGVTSGLELMLLPQGQQLQKDLLERSECMKLFVAITILVCISKDERVKMLNKWIEIAMETKTTIGNFYGFTGIMLGLSIPQVTQLHSTWHSLRHSHTDAAFSHETKLRPILKAMQETSAPQAPNTCIPYMLSLISILQEHLSVVQIMEDEPLKENEIKEKILSFGLPGEHNSDDFGLQLLEDHLEVGRSIMQQWPMFRKNGEITLQNVKYDELLLDIFRTEFHLRMLWGYRGAQVAANERYEKFDHVLNALSERCKKQEHG